MSKFNPELRAKAEKRWAETEAIKQTPQYKRMERIAEENPTLEGR